VPERATAAQVATLVAMVDALRCDTKQLRAKLDALEQRETLPPAAMAPLKAALPPASNIKRRADGAFAGTSWRNGRARAGSWTR
jgi:hypothetical protein